MLAGDDVGWRSGTRPLAGLPVAQKKSNVRRSMSSKSSGSGGRAPRAGGVAALAAFDVASAALESYARSRTRSGTSGSGSLSAQPASGASAATPPDASNARRVRSTMAKKRLATSVVDGQRGAARCDDAGIELRAVLRRSLERL